MNKITVLDVTLRDGGCVNNFNFGQVYMEKILKAQEESGVEMIEMGYIDEKNGSESGRTQYVNEQVIPQTILKNKKKGVTYVAMMDRKNGSQMMVSRQVLRENLCLTCWKDLELRIVLLLLQDILEEHFWEQEDW